MIGASTLTRGGLPNGFRFAQDCGCECIQLYVAPSRAWNVIPLTDELEARFRAAWEQSGIISVVAHASLLLNLASPDIDLRGKSISRLIAEMCIAERLGIPSIVIHPGSNPDRQAGVAHIVESLNEVAASTNGVSVLLETVAGQGNSIGRTFEELDNILQGLQSQDRFGVCLDTCHVFAAGYDIRGQSGYDTTIAHFDQIIGINRIGAFHVNDSRVELGKRVDRHADLIGEGHIGLQTFHALLHDTRFINVPLILEVPDGENLTKQNVDVLKRLRSESEIPPEKPKTNTLFEIS